jgi:hypothetical protein
MSAEEVVVLAAEVQVHAPASNPSAQGIVLKAVHSAGKGVYQGCQEGEEG